MENIISNNKNYLLSKNVYNNNSKMLKDIVTKLNENRFVIISGQTGVGKKNIVKELVIKTNLENNFIYFNKQLDFNNEIKGLHDMKKLIESSKYNLKLIVLENVNKINEIKDFIKYVYIEKNIKLIIISNNIKIKGTPEIEVRPVSFKSLNLNNYNISNMLNYGSLNNILSIEDISIKKLLLEFLYSKIVLEDIVGNFGLRDTETYKYTITKIAEINDFISARELVKKINDDGLKISLVTLLDYINFSINSKIIRKISKYDIKTKKELASKAKYYFTDLGIRNSLLNYTIPNNTLIENLVFNELSSRGYNIFSGISGIFEFTFLVKMSKFNIYINVSKQKSKKEIKKEVNKFLKIGNNNPKYIIVESLDDLGIKETSFDSVKIMEVSKFFDEIVFN